MPDKPLNELTARVWLLTEAATVAGVRVSTATNWLARGQISSLDADENLSAGKKRRYSAVDTLRLLVVGRLATFGIPVEVADKLARAALDCPGLTAVAGYKNTPLAVLVNVFQGRRLLVHHDGRRFRALDADDAADAVLVIDLGMAAQHVVSALQDLLDDDADEVGAGDASAPADED